MGPRAWGPQGTALPSSDGNATGDFTTAKSCFAMRSNKHNNKYDEDKSRTNNIPNFNNKCFGCVVNASIN